MEKFEFWKQLELLISSFIVSVVASFVRILFYRNDSFWRTVANFIGGIAFGVLAGYIANDIDALSKYENIITAIFALAGRELCEVLIKTVPSALRNYITSKSNNNAGNNS